MSAEVAARWQRVGEFGKVVSMGTAEGVEFEGEGRAKTHVPVH